MIKGIYLSIKSEFTKKIETGEKNYEFRNYKPKEKINILYVYEPAPTYALKYIIELSDIIEYPKKITKAGYGNDDFNNGLKKSKYAYQIKHVDILENPIPLSVLKSEYGFTVPQSYAYDSRYPKLTEEINSTKIKRIM